ncbi:Rv3235 family protein [Streptomyces sp. NBC_00576]|uniref:Rv3235 family protein n=1 Tax=Streptomyces sp. NBC_00576 TaxID=2903665 RepID=UPI002E80E0B3|nr:Rv3235 family protein [Streptomyces sp. NBC_00576]WUB71711.1 Rv3235 family protein [Streptomyces sp. NBC_00576]
MNKVMTRTVRHTPSRPPVRRDTRRPGSTPHRTPPGGGTPRTPFPEATAPSETHPEPRVPAQGQRQGPGQRQGGGQGQHPEQHRPTPPRPLQQPSQPRQTALQQPRALPQPRPTDLFADRLLAVLSGERPVHSMLRHTVGRAYDELAWLAARGPLRTRGTRPVVRDVGYYEPSRGALEAFARIGAGDQLRAMAFRLELGRDFRWRCTAVELGGPRRPHTADD